MKKTLSGRNLDVNLEIMTIWKCCALVYSFKIYICQDPRINRAYTAQNTKKTALLACLVQRLSAFTSRCRTDKAERGALEPPTEDAFERGDLTDKFQFRESHPEAETKKS